jgi:glucose-1-phosphate thymidylyltransferase
VQVLGRGFAWLDTGTHESLVNATMFIKTVEDRQDLKIACLEEIAFNNGWIDRDQLRKLAAPLQKSGYGSYLMRVADERS